MSHTHMFKTSRRCFTINFAKMTEDNTPAVIFVFSGKRKSGKDYVTDILQTRLGKEKCSILRLSAPLKEQYAKDHALDFSKLLDASEYKEKYRADMIVWGEEKRNADPGYFCRLATSGRGSEKPIWIISDARRKTDVEYFQKNFPKQTVTVRITADLDVRQQRGFVFTAGVDDVDSECGLDEGVDWDVVVENNSDADNLNKHLDNIVQKWCL